MPTQMPSEIEVPSEHKAEFKAELKRINGLVRDGERSWLKGVFDGAILPHVPAFGRVETVTFYSNWDAFKEKKESSMALGRFIGTKYKGERASDYVPYVALQNIYKVIVTKNQKKIVDAYERGPNSCMKIPATEFTESLRKLGACTKKLVHPMQIYAGEDTSVAIVYNDKGVPLARTVLVEKEKSFVRIYFSENDEARQFLSFFLFDNGYKAYNYGQAMSPIKIATIAVKIKTENRSPLMGYVLPYLDFEAGSPLLTNDGIVFTRDLRMGKRLYPLGTHFSCDKVLRKCKCCSNYIPLDNLNGVEKRWLCINCIKKYKIKYWCGLCNQPFHTNDKRKIHYQKNTVIVCPDCVVKHKDSYNYCGACDSLVSRELEHCPSCGSETKPARHYIVLGKKLVLPHIAA